MTKKHFRKLAHGLATIEPVNVEEAEYAIWESCVYMVAGVCEAENPRFDRGRFLEACHYDYWKTHKVPA